MGKKRIIMGATGASGLPLLIKCLKEIKENAGFESYLIMSDSSKITLEQETDYSLKEVYALADYTFEPDEIGAEPASGTFETEGMLIAPCSMKTIAGIHCGYGDNLLMRAADVTIKEKRKLVLAPRETPLSPIHLKNLWELSMLPEIRIIPPMLSYYMKPESIEEMTSHIAAKLLEPFGIRTTGYQRWKGLDKIHR